MPRNLRADIAVISDTKHVGCRHPRVSTRVRGMLYTQIDIAAANKDLHSGLFGGSALNPINLITRSSATSRTRRARS